jgi:hypothetical protein
MRCYDIVKDSLHTFWIARLVSGSGSPWPDRGSCRASASTRCKTCVHRDAASWVQALQRRRCNAPSDDSVA